MSRLVSWDDDGGAVRFPPEVLDAVSRGSVTALCLEVTADGWEALALALQLVGAVEDRKAALLARLGIESQRAVRAGATA